MSIQVEYDGRGNAALVDVDTSATTHGETITVRRHRFHEGTVLAARVFYRENLEAEAAQP